MSPTWQQEDNLEMLALLPCLSEYRNCGLQSVRISQESQVGRRKRLKPCTSWRDDYLPEKHSTPFLHLVRPRGRQERRELRQWQVRDGSELTLTRAAWPHMPLALFLNKSLMSGPER